MRLSLGLAVIGLVALAGCGGGDTAPIAAPSYDASTMAEAAVKQFDKNANNMIDGTELDACPSIKSVLSQLDTNKDKGIDYQELIVRFMDYTKQGAGSVKVGARARVNGNMLPDVEVTFVPEDFMQGTIQGGSGKSDKDGIVSVMGNPGLANGFYRVKFSLKTGGAEVLPAKYASGAAVGVEVFTGRGGGSQFDFNITR
jgi:hypothetical protein